MRLPRSPRGTTAQTDAARQLAQASTTPAEATIELVWALDRPFDDGLFPWLEAALEKIEHPPAGQAGQLAEIIERFLNRLHNPMPRIGP
jgi:hypothetical protein